MIQGNSTTRIVIIMRTVFVVSDVNVLWQMSLLRVKMRNYCAMIVTAANSPPNVSVVKRQSCQALANWNTMDRPGTSTASSAIVASSPLDPVLLSQKTKPITASHAMKANLHHDAHIAKRF